VVTKTATSVAVFVFLPAGHISSIRGECVLNSRLQHRSVLGICPAGRDYKLFCVYEATYGNRSWYTGSIMQGKIRWWAVGRRFQYGMGFLSFWILIGAWVYYANFYLPPTCFDRVQNGDESGIDCGGTCVPFCSAAVLPPQVVWVKSFKIAEGQYNAVAYVENANQTAATPELKYTFQLLNQGVVVAERSGKTILPQNNVYPIFEGKIFTEAGAEVTETKIILEPANLWLPAASVRDQFRSVDINLSNADVRPRLDVVIENTALTEARDIEVVATVFKDGGEPVTASQTFIDYIGPRSTQNIVFTWPNSITKTIKSCIIPTDVAVVIDLSGSMNNDGGEPPQPVTAALAAAAKFVETLKEKDQVSLITFATEAMVRTGFTKDQKAVASSILALTIDKAEETGYTNTAAALLTAQNELNSASHNTDARRVMVFLTDGLPTAAGDADVIAEAIAAAQIVSNDAIELYAIGLGSGVNEQFIRAIATGETNAFFAPTTDDLERIYAEITSSLCTSGPTKIDVIAKTKTNFAPLR
jgi:Mg-chelatase subunit ChlD